MSDCLLDELARRGVERLSEEDPVLYRLLEAEHGRQSSVLTMVAASGVADSSVLACEGTAVTNVTTEGYPGSRFHAGCSVVDEIERLAVERAKEAFGAQYANVQPHSGTSANGIVMFSLLEPGDTILGLDLGSGGHLTHGSHASVIGQYFNPVLYGVDDDGRIDYEQVRELALEHRPKLLICGASCYPRVIHFERFREIADLVGAFVLADISHIAGLVAAGQHPSPIDHAHFTTTSTYKQLYGPRGGLIMIGEDARSAAPGPDATLADMVQRAVFPYFQGTPNLSAIAGKARALQMVATAEFESLAAAIVADAAALADAFLDRGYRVLTGGTDNHIVLIDVRPCGITGVQAERSLERCGIIVNKNKIAGDPTSAFVTSGLRLGTNSLALRGMGAAEMSECADLVDRVLSSLRVEGERDFELPDGVHSSVSAEVARLCDAFPIPGFPLTRQHAKQAGDSRK